MNHDLYMQRCFDLARLGTGQVSPNPMVGAVLVYKDRIIGEGWHKKYGQAHAEVNAVNSVLPIDRHLIKEATLYVSLEPCCIHGKTPPCTDLILKNDIKKVVVSCLDQTANVKGNGIKILEGNGIEVIKGILEDKGQKISAIRNTTTSKKRPFIQLKFARTRNGYMGKEGEQVWISNLISKRLAHKKRAELDAILVGTNTAIVDSPKLTNRLWFGKSPLRILLDRKLCVPLSNEIYNDQALTWVFTENTPLAGANPYIHYKKIEFNSSLIDNLLSDLAINNITSLIVEGGAYTLNRFIEKGFWDEAWVFTGKRIIERGIKAPIIDGVVIDESLLGDDLLTIFSNSNPQPLNLL